MSERRARISRKFDDRKQGRLMMVEGIFLVVLTAVILFCFVLGITSVSGASMEPTYTNGETVVFLRLNHSYQVGQIVSIRMTSGDFYIKRIVAGPGDTFDLEDGQLIVNGNVVSEPYATGRTEAEKGLVTYPLTLKDGEYFVLGDNREASVDSRSFGPVVRSQIVGRIISSF